MDLDVALDRLAAEPDAPLDVAELALLLARDEYPGLDVAAYLGRLDRLAEAVRPRLHNGALVDYVQRLGEFLFVREGFRGNAEDYYDPRNSYLNDVLDRRLGIPITLTVVAMAVGGRAGLRIEGVGLPGHFLARAVDATGAWLFDPFHGGQIRDATDCADLVRQATGQPPALIPGDLAPVTLHAVLARMLANLAGIYRRRDDPARLARVLGRTAQLRPADAGVRRDLGASLVLAGQPGKAIDHLRRALRLTERPEEVSAVQGWLRRAEREAAQWN